MHRRVLGTYCLTIIAVLPRRMFTSSFASFTVWSTNNLLPTPPSVSTSFDPSAHSGDK
ncbi:hypothetical protein CY34DRAFT_807211 [Suillus luteus UH-Slu-Lm8-n1]|uniref:Unplaced genomic scaffold CY34scaffold_172, whole genome shotgun sequence n=1 Tax=Suillus luteus UH-Slu-Lm8-n1 TaxID=930992 RepID=A0A0D0B9S9_9AGAM|nr:hypothetical protein CY34DRAFT_807211 [Suillus luteus UH-Slu-Lm8-n1]